MKVFLLSALALSAAAVPEVPKSYSFDAVLSGTDTSGLTNVVYAIDTARGFRQYLSGDTDIGEMIVRTTMVDICLGNETILYMDVAMPDKTHQCSPMDSECQPNLHRLFDLVPHTEPSTVPCSTPAGTGTWHNATFGDSFVSYCANSKADYGTAVYYASIISPDGSIIAEMSSWSTPAAGDLFVRPAACDPFATRVRGVPLGARVAAHLKRIMKRN